MNETTKKKLSTLARTLKRLTMTELAQMDYKTSDALMNLNRCLNGQAPPGTMSQAERELCQHGRKIEAIKAVRERTGMGLKEAKDMVEKEFPPLY